MKPGVTSRPSASMTSRARRPSTRPIADDAAVARPRRRRARRARRCRRRRCRRGSADRAARALTATGGGRCRTSRARSAPNNPARASSGPSLAVLAQLVDDAGVLRVAVREVGRPDEPVAAARARPSSAAVRSPGSKLIQHWRRKYSSGVERQSAAWPSRSSRGTRRAGPSSARSSRRRTRAPRPAGRGAARARRRTRGSRASSPGRTARISAWCVPGAIRWPICRDAPGMSARPAGWNASGSPRLLERLPHRACSTGWCNGRSLYAFGRANPPTSPRLAMRCASSAAASGSCIGSAPMPTSRFGAAAHHSAIQSL